MKNHDKIVDYKESLGTGSVSVNAAPQVFPGQTGDSSHVEKSSDRVDTVSQNLEKERLSRKQLTDAKNGQTVSGISSVIFYVQQIEMHPRWFSALLAECILF